MGTITMYAHHIVHDAEKMAADGESIDAALADVGHDWSEQMFLSEDRRNLLLIAEFGGSEDLKVHFETLERLGYSDDLDTVFSVTSADVVGEVDADARAELAKYDFVHFLSAPPEG